MTQLLSFRERVNIYQDLRRELRDLDDRIEGARARATSLQGPNFQKVGTGGNMPGSPVETMAIEIVELERTREKFITGVTAYKKELEGELDRLPDKEREAVFRRYLEGQTNEETADAMEISERYVRYLLTSAMQKL
jgi:RNA polymerase sigma factor (sigma-70 family)